MSHLAKALLAALLTYFLVHAGYLLTGFQPFRALPQALGWAVDIGIWMTLYGLLYGTLDRLSRPDGPPKEDL